MLLLPQMPLRAEWSLGAPNSRVAPLPHEWSATSNLWLSNCTSEWPPAFRKHWRSFRQSVTDHHDPLASTCALSLSRCHPCEISLREASLANHFPDCYRLL